MLLFRFSRFISRVLNSDDNTEKNEVKEEEEEANRENLG